MGILIMGPAHGWFQSIFTPKLHPSYAEALQCTSERPRKASIVAFRAHDNCTYRAW